MRSVAFTYYHPPMRHDEVSFGAVRLDVPDAVSILGYEASIASFCGLYVDTWIAPTARASARDGPKVFGSIKTGATGAADQRLMGLDLLPSPDGFFLQHWAHNVTWFAKDWHATYVLYYEPTTNP